MNVFKDRYLINGQQPR